MAVVRIDTAQIVDWGSFHSVFKSALGFPDFYGKNMNAWIDCLSYLREETGMSSVLLGSGEVLVLELPDSKSFRTRVPGVFDELVACTAFVNRRYRDRREPPAIALAFG